MAIVKKEDVMPITQKGIRSLAQTDYGTFDKALAELIDNSWELGYCTTFSNIVSHFNGPKKTLNLIEVIDNGPGMSLDILDKCLTIGSEVEKNAQTLGTYGMGLKSASLWCGNHVTVLTKCEDGPLLKAVFGPEIGRVIETVEDVTLYEKFSKIVKGHHGTVIAIDEVNTYRFPKKKNTFTDNIVKGHGIVFSELLKANHPKMMVNSVEVNPVEYVNKEISTKISEDNAVWKYVGVDGTEKEIKYEAWFTPRNNSENDEKFLPRNQENQGFICVRNGHMTGKGLTFGIVTKNNIFNGCKIILYLDGSTDNDFGVSFGKTQRGNIAADGIKECFFKEFKRYFDTSAKMQNQNAKNGETTEAIDKAVEKIENEIANNDEIQEALKEFKCNYEGEKTKGVNKKNDEPKAVDKNPVDETKEKKHRKPRDGETIKVCKKNFKIVHEAFGENNQYFQPDCTPEGIGICRINTDHNYYVNYMQGRSFDALVDVYRNFACEWLSVYGADADKSEEGIEQYNKRLLVKSKALSVVYKNKMEDDI